MRRLLLFLLVSLLCVQPVQAQVSYPFTDFRPGQLILSGESNANFQAIADAALNRTGGTITGNITINPGITIDGADISAFLTNQRVYAQMTGTVGAPSYSVAGDTSTGWYLPATGQIAWALSGAQDLLLNASGLTIYGNGIFNSSGKVPAISSTYFGSLDGSVLQIAEGSIANGTILARNAANETITGLWQYSNSLAIAANWNASGITFTGLDVNPTSTASAAGSKLVDFRLSGTSTLSIDKAGALAASTLAVTSAPCNGCVLIGDANGVGQWVDLSNAVPSGMLAFFEAACPTGWTRDTIYDGNFIRGGAAFDALGGGSNAAHSHTIDPPIATTSSAGAHNHTVDFPPTTTSSAGAHNHTWGGSTTGSMSDDGAHTHTYSISVTTGGDNAHAAKDNSSPDVSVAPGGHTHTINVTLTTASTGAHHHTISGQFTTTAGAHTHTLDLPITTSSTDGTHTHTLDIAAFTSSADVALPAYITAVVCKKN